jgi:Sec-independent protein secretion pathway component TatC
VKRVTLLSVISPATTPRPGTDPVTTLLELIPMLVLFELSILGATVLERRRR